MTISERIDVFLDAEAFGVVGASSKLHKYGNKVLRCYQQNQRTVVPVNPVEKQIEGLACVASVNDLPDHVGSISIITPSLGGSRTSGCSRVQKVTGLWQSVKRPELT
jgi:predicted CoA-binding protein